MTVNGRPLHLRRFRTWVEAKAWSAVVAQETPHVDIVFDPDAVIVLWW